MIESLSEHNVRPVSQTRTNLQHSLANFFEVLGDGYKDYSFKIRSLTVSENEILRMLKDVTILDAMEVTSSLHRAVISEILTTDLGNIDATWNFPTSAKGVSSTGPPPFPKSGLSLSAVKTFIVKCGGKSALAGMSTTEVNNHAQKPLTFFRQASYCDMMKDIGDSGVKPAMVFISHAWKYIFLDVVEAIENHFRDEPDVIIWFDLFSNNQHLAPDLDFYWWNNTF